MRIIDFIIACSVLIIADLSVELIRNKWSKQCNYECANCKVWDCRRHVCLEKSYKNKEK